MKNDVSQMNTKIYFISVSECTSKLLLSLSFDSMSLFILGLLSLSVAFNCKAIC